MTSDSRHWVPLDSAARHLAISAYRLEYLVEYNYVPYHRDERGFLRFDLAELDAWANMQAGRDQLLSWSQRPGATNPRPH